MLANFKPVHLILSVVTYFGAMQCAVADELRSFNESDAHVKLPSDADAGAVDPGRDPHDWLKSLKEPPKVKRNLVLDSPFEPSINGAENEYGTLDLYSPVSMRMHAAEHLKKGNYDLAIKLLEPTIEKTPEDFDCRQLYADALEQKYKADATGNPHTFNKCVKQWYFLYRSSEYPEMITLAAKHLQQLTGRSPYIWPTPKLFLSKVLKQEDAGTTIDTNPNVIATPEPAQVH